MEIKIFKNYRTAMDLIQTILTESAFLRNFHFIAMLTNDDISTEGNKIEYKKAKAGFYNTGLVNYLSTSIRSYRNINLIEPYFNHAGIAIEIVDELFENNGRNQYFKNVGNRNFEKSLIFFDPDNGLEVKNNNEKHLLFTELEYILERTTDDSLLMIYQHFPRVKRKEYIKYRLSEIQIRLGHKTSYISDNEIVFFFIAKQDKIFKELNYILNYYNQKYSKLVSPTKHLIESQQKISFCL